MTKLGKANPGAFDQNAKGRVRVSGKFLPVVSTTALLQSPRHIVILLISLLLVELLVPLGSVQPSDLSAAVKGTGVASSKSRSKALMEKGNDLNDQVGKRAALEEKTEIDPKKEAAVAAQVELGAIYENHGRLRDAETAYAKALESSSAATRQKALESLRRITEKQVSKWNDYIFSPIGWPLTPGIAKSLTVVTVTIILLVLWWCVNCFGRHYGDDKVQILSVVDSTEKKIGSHFVEIILTTLEKFRLHYRTRHVIEGVKVPVIARSQGAKLAELAESAAPGAIGKVIAWIMRKIDQPRYTIYGSLQSDGRNINILTRLNKSGKMMRFWDITFPAADLFDREKDLAYELLLVIKEDMNP